MYHEATGHYWKEDVVWCGVCTRDFVKFLKGQLNRKWGKMRFYDYAFVPPEKKP